MCDYINDYFVDVGKNVSHSIPTSSKNKSATHLISSNPNSLFLRPITLFEMKNLISDLKVKKSVPSYSVPIQFIKLATDVISPFLVWLFNLCFTHGCFPEVLKMSEVLPIHKAGSKAKATNYRPIALLSPFAKLLEKAIYSRIDNFFYFQSFIFS